MSEQSENFESTSSGGDDDNPMAAVLPFVTAIVALLLGVALGVAIGWTSKPSETTAEVAVPRDLTQAELQQLCNEDETLTELEQAKDKIGFLEKEIEARNARVKELEAKADDDPEPMVPGTSSTPSRGRNLARELAQAQADLKEALEELEVVRAEKDALIAELESTKEELSDTRVALTAQKKKTRRAKEDALVNKWYRFVNGAQLDICDKGNRRKLGRCREVVQDTLMTNSRRDRFAHCVRSGQAVPTVMAVDSRDQLPTFSEMIDEEQKQTKGWAVLFCDPTLPEGDGFLNEVPLPSTEEPVATRPR
ncbi:MAG: hypothetical protein AAGA48_31095 [Myxococcota bacterium]